MLPKIRAIIQTPTIYGYPTVTFHHQGVSLTLGDGHYHAHQMCTWEEVTLSKSNPIEELLKRAEKMLDELVSTEIRKDRVRYAKPKKNS